jgi:glycosyltransferase involved in cell wall biosynthesis
VSPAVLRDFFIFFAFHQHLPLTRIYFTVTTDLSYDQRMDRICSSLAENGFDIVLVGRRLKHSLPLTDRNYKTVRLGCWFNKGKAFYVEYNLRLLLFLLFKKMDGICAIDLDTIIPCYYTSKFKGIKRIYDAHELFTELKEVITRPAVKRLWLRIERKFVPRFKWGYTVSDGIAQEFHRRYKVDYLTIRNLPVLRPLSIYTPAEKFILYQGAVNEARGLESLVEAMKMISTKLVIAGDGNFMKQLKNLIVENNVQDKVIFKGMLPPGELFGLTQQATFGVAFPESEGLNQLLALPNKFFDYLHGGLPQITVDYPEYRKINEVYNVAVLVPDIKPPTIAMAVNGLLNDPVRLASLKENCLNARQELNWQKEEPKLINFYRSIFTE